MTSAILNLHYALILSMKFLFNLAYGLRGLNLHVSLNLPTKFWFDLTYGLGGDILRISISWISKWNYFSNFESVCSG